MRVSFRTEETKEFGAAATAGEDYEEKEGVLEFAHNETLKEIRI